MLRAALVLGLILGIPTFAVIAATGTAARWHATTQLEVHGDTWDGNMATDGQRVYLLTREGIIGFWGVLYVRASDDRGATWAEPVQVSAAGGPSAARHALTIGPDGSLWAAWAQAGEQEATQQLILRRSRDGGATWEEPIRVSEADVGLIGIPAVVMTAHGSFVVFTDGQDGTVYVQHVETDGTPFGDPVVLATTTRTLYDDASLLDGGVSAVSVDGRGVIVMHNGDHLWRYLRAAPGTRWMLDPWHTVPMFASPRVVAVDGQVTTLAAVPTGDGFVQISAQTSSDGGRTWDSGADWHDPNAGSASLAAAPDQALALWEGCGGAFCEPVIRIGDIGAATGRSQRVAGDTGRLAGALLTADTMIVAWIREGESFEPEDRTVVVATGPRPPTTGRRP